MGPLSPATRRGLLIGGATVLLGGIYAIRRIPFGPAVHPVAKRRLLPDFTWPTLAGVPWSPATEHGNVVFLNFWATWCGPCREETPALVRVWSDYRSRGVVFAAPSLDDDPSAVVPAFLREYGVEYPILIPPADALIVQSVQSIPTSYLLDRQRRVARVWLGIVYEQDLRRALDALLAE